MQRNSPNAFPLAERAVFTGGTATGGTDLTAFDAALQAAGIHNANLLSISSVLPESATVEVKRAPEHVESLITPGGFYPTVYTAETSDQTNETVYATVAGCEFASGYGINVERHGTNRNREEVRDECERMLEEMAANRDETLASDVWFRYEATSVPTGDEWACAVAAVLYL